MNSNQALREGLYFVAPHRLSQGRKSRATTRTLDYRANDVYFSKIVDIGKDIFVTKKISRRKLESRDAICKYLNISPATYKRWRALGLPVSGNGGGKTTVEAFTDELSEWRERHENFDKWRKIRPSYPQGVTRELHKLPASEIARKHQISRKTVQRYKKRLMRTKG